MNNYYRYPFLRPHPVTSPYGPRAGGMHYGTDYGWNVDEGPSFPVCAAADGTVAYFADEGPGGGRTMTIRHAGGEQTRYYHLDHAIQGPGAIVVAGQIVAMSGDSGGVAPHLHFEIRDAYGRTVDPETVLEWPDEPPPVPPDLPDLPPVDTFDPETLKGDPMICCAVGKDGVVHVFATGVDTAVWTTYAAPGDPWSPWTSLGGAVRTPPEATLDR